MTREPNHLLMQSIRINKADEQRSLDPAMYVCVCNAIRESQLRHAARRVEGDAEAVYASLGFRPQCGTCLEEADEMIAEERALCRRPRLVA